MKKTLSIILSIVMLFSIAATSNLSAYAGGWMDTVKIAELNTTYSESCSTKEPILYGGGTKAYMEAYSFEIPFNGTITTDTYYGNEFANLNAGKYYFVIDYYDLYDYYSGTYDITLNYKPNISTPSSFKASTQNANSLKLSWSKVANIKSITCK